MARELTILLRVKNAMQIGLAKGYASLQQFGKSAMRIGKFFATSFLAAGASIAGFAAKALSSYAESETAQNSMAAAFRAFGEEVDVNTARVLASAKAIQSETGVSDEAVVSMAARLRMLGVQSSKLDEATRATIGLKAAGMEEEAAAKALALAYSGNYTQLGRYIPALRNANTESEKAAILADFVARGYSQQQAKLETVAGQWGLLKERVGDVWEEVGRAIEQNGALTKVLSLAGDAVKKFGERVAEWVEGGGMTNLLALAAEFFNTMRYYFGLVGNTVHVVWASLNDGAETAFTYVMNVVSAFKGRWVAEMTYIKDFALAVWNAIKHPFEIGWNPPSMAPMRKALDDLVNAFKGKDARVTKQMDEAMAVRAQLEAEYAARSVSIAAWQAEALNKQLDTTTKNKAAALAAEETLEVEAAEKKVALADELAEALGQSSAERTAVESSSLDQIVKTNQGASEAVKGIWQDNLKSFSQIEATKVAVAQGAAAAISGMSGGTIETSDKFRIAKLRAAGIDPNMANGSVLTTQQSKALDNVTQTQILAELQKMNAKQDKLMTFG